MQQSIDPSVPAQIPADQLQDFKSFLDVVLDTVVGGAAPDVHALGLQLWGGLAAVMVAWTGLKIAFSGTFQPWEIIKLVIGIAIPRTMLHYYIVPIPGVGLTFPAVAEEGSGSRTCSARLRPRPGIPRWPRSSRPTPRTSERVVERECSRS